MIYHHSACAKAGDMGVADRTNFKTNAKVAARLFRLIENLLVYLKKDAGEEIFCVCVPSKES
jgi:hypothetical protein